MKKQSELSVIIGLFGRYEKLVNQFDKAINELKNLPEEVEKIIVADGDQWSFAPLFQLLDVIVNNVKVIIINEETHLPAIVFNEGLKNSTAQYVVFHHLMCGEVTNSVNAFFEYKNTQKEKVLYIKNIDHGNVEIDPPVESIYGYLLSNRIISLNEVIIERNIAETLNLFNDNKILQKDFDRLVMIKLASQHDLKVIANTNHPIYDLKQYPFDKYYNFSQDIVHRYINHNTGITRQTNKEIDNCFYNDIESDYLSRNIKFNEKKDQVVTKYNKKYKITILGGYWEYHHNRVVFFNYFQKLFGQGFCTYKTLFDSLVTVDEIRDSDLVIFTRCRSNNIGHIIDYCNDNGIATMYMIDDNWISIAKDYPELYGNLFVEGNPNYDNFINALKKCKTTLLYSDVIAEDVEPYAQHITKFRISIEPEYFNVSNKRERNDNEILIGFAGSLRWQDEPFKALARVAKEFPNTKVFFMGSLSQKQKEYFDGIDYIEVPFCSYGTYAKHISELSPDLIIAPLVNDRTNSSKCYNKYVEMGIVSAACIYSKQKPYTDIINEGKNGFFVEGESEKEWYKKMRSILKDVSLLRKVQTEAYNDIIQHHTVDSALNDFADMIINVIEGEFK